MLGGRMKDNTAIINHNLGLRTLGLVLILAFCNTIANEATAANNVNIFIGKLKIIEEESTRSYTRFGTGFLIDNRSITSDGFHSCSNEVKLLGTNYFFKGRRLGSKVEVQFHLPYTNGRRGFYSRQATLIGRDYFSGLAVLEFKDGNLIDDFAAGFNLVCTGLKSVGNPKQALGFKYYRMKESNHFLKKSKDRGLNGALVFSDQNTGIGFLSPQYFYSKKDSDNGLKVMTFDRMLDSDPDPDSNPDYITQIYTLDQVESFKGMINYLPDQERFYYEGEKDAFVLAPISAKRAKDLSIPSNRVIILGAPEEVIQNWDRDTYFSRKSVHNAFSKLHTKFDTGSKANSLVYAIKSIEGTEVSDWNSVIDILSNGRVKGNLNFEIDIYQDGQPPFSFLTGNRHFEQLSLIRWYVSQGILTGHAVKDKRKNKPSRKLTQKELNVFTNIEAPVNDLYISTIAHMTLPNQRAYYKQMSNSVNEIIKHLYKYSRRTRTMMPRFQKGNTILYIQSKIIGIQKWISTEQSSMTRATYKER